MPKNGLPVIKGLAKILSFSSVNVSRGKAYDALLATINDLLKKTNILKHRLNNRTEYVKEYCIELRNKVQLTTEEAIQQINQFNEQIIAEIDKYEKELIELNSNNSDLMKNFQQLSHELEEFNSKTNEYLNEYNLNDEQLVNSNNEATVLINKTELNIQNLNSVILDERLMSFEPNTVKINKSILGELKIKASHMDSSILNNTDKFKELMILCEFPVYQKWSLIYRASQNGFEGANFHANCDNKPNNLVVIKSDNGNIFGGYTEQSWASEKNEWKNDPYSFIFSFVNLDEKPIKMNVKEPTRSIGCCKIHGPIFGGNVLNNKSTECDIYIHNNSNLNKNSYSNLGNGYIHPDYTVESTEIKSFLAGSFNFTVAEIEVYTKI